MTNKNLIASDKIAGEFLNKIGKSLEQYAIREYNKSAFAKSAMLAIMENNDLASALMSEQGRITLFQALRYAASTGLSLNPQEGKACLIAYEKDGKHNISYQIMKNGMIDLAMDSGNVEFLTVDTVRDGDLFSLEKTSDGDKYHFTPALQDRGEIIGFFAAIKLKSGSSHVCWMTKEEIEGHRDAYSAMYKYKPEKSPWAKSFEGMGLKTVIKKLFRNLRISREVDIAVGTDDKMEVGDTPDLPGFSADDVKKKLEEKGNEKNTDAKVKDANFKNAEKKEQGGSLL